MDVSLFVSVKSRGYEHPYLVKDPGGRQDKAGDQRDFDITDETRSRAEHDEAARGGVVRRGNQRRVVRVAKQSEKSLRIESGHKFRCFRFDVLRIRIGGEFPLRLGNKTSNELCCLLVRLEFGLGRQKYFGIRRLDKLDNLGGDQIGVKSSPELKEISGLLELYNESFQKSPGNKFLKDI